MTIALVLGGAKCVRADLYAAGALSLFDAVIAVNNIGAEWEGDLAAWVTLHPTLYPGLLAKRRERGYPEPEAFFAYTQAPPDRRLAETLDIRLVECKFPGQIHGGSSGLFAAKVALIDLGFDKAALAGVPMDPEQAHFDAPDEPWSDCVGHNGIGMRLGWEEAMPAIKDRLRSMSGWTRDRLGAPDAEWLAAPVARA